MKKLKEIIIKKDVDNEHKGKFGKSVEKREISLDYLKNIKNYIKNAYSPQMIISLNPDIGKIVQSIKEKSNDFSNLSNDCKFEATWNIWKDSITLLNAKIIFNTEENLQHLLPQVEVAKDAAESILDIANKCEEFRMLSAYSKEIQKNIMSEITIKIKKKMNTEDIDEVIKSIREHTHEISSTYSKAKSNIGDEEAFEAFKKAVENLRNTALEQNIELDTFEAYSSS